MTNHWSGVAGGWFLIADAIVMFPMGNAPARDVDPLASPRYQAPKWTQVDLATNGASVAKWQQAWRVYSS